MKRVNFHLTQREIGWLDAISEKSGILKSELIRRAIDRYIDDQKSSYGITGPKECVEAKS